MTTGNFSHNFLCFLLDYFIVQVKLTIHRKDKKKVMATVSSTIPALKQSKESSSCTLSNESVGLCLPVSWLYTKAAAISLH